MRLAALDMLVEKAVQRYELTCRGQRERERSAEKSGFSEPAKVVTISRLLGAGGASIAAKVGEALGWAVWDKEILDVLASQSKQNYEARMFEALDQRTQTAIEHFLAPFFGKADRHAYFYLLAKAIRIIAQQNAIILGRGSPFVLPEAFHVFLKAPLEARAENVMQRLNVTKDKALKEVRKRDRRRRSFMRQMADRLGKRVSRYGLEFDIEINTSRLDLHGAVDVIVCAVSRRFGL